MKVNKRINIWSSPRNISTALMYSFAQRKDMTVIDEPLYAHYLVHTNSQAKHPGKEEILHTLEQDGQKVVDNMLHHEYTTPNVLFKQMTHHLIALEESFLFKMENVLLIRNPKYIIASYSKVIPNPTIQDIGIEMQYELFQKLLSKTGKIPAVVDTKKLLLSPESVLKKLCAYLGLAFDENMLEWTKGPRLEDGCWAKYWYANVHQSTGFQPYKEKEIELEANAVALLSECQPYYNRLLTYAIN